MRVLHGLLWVCLLVGIGHAMTNPHVIFFGKVQSVAWLPPGRQQDSIALKIRPLYVDGKLKEYTLGPPRDITERLFVIRRVFQVNDALASEKQPRWRWERGGWITVDRSTGRVTPLSLPGFDTFHSVAVWYRDYAAYCGTSDDSTKVYAMVVQLGHRKPLFRQLLLGMSVGPGPDSACPAPVWQRDPPRVTFKLNGGQELTFSLGERHAEVAAEDRVSAPD